MKPRHAVALALVGWYLMLPPWVAQNQFDSHAPFSKWEISGRFDTAEHCRIMRQAAVDWYIDHPKEKEASWNKRLFSTGQCVPDDDPRLNKEIRTPRPSI